MDRIIHGIEFGLLLGFLVGPAFFTLLQTSVERGFRNGAALAFGFSMSDTLCVLISYFGFSGFISDPANRWWLGWAGGSMLIVFGSYHLFLRSRNNGTSIQMVQQIASPFRYVFKGFIINSLSPTVIVFWIGVLSIVSLEFRYSSGRDYALFFGPLLATTLSMDLTKAWLSDRLRRWVTPAIIKVMNLVLGLVLIGAGVRLIVVGY